MPAYLGRELAQVFIHSGTVVTAHDSGELACGCVLEEVR
jgi:hypothetical protein